METSDLRIQTTYSILELRKLQIIHRITETKINAILSDIASNLKKIIFLQNLYESLDFEKLKIQYTIMVNKFILEQVNL
jgi:hypothetical protein